MGNKQNKQGFQKEEKFSQQKVEEKEQRKQQIEWMMKIEQEKLRKEREESKRNAELYIQKCKEVCAKLEVAQQILFDEKTRFKRLKQEDAERIIQKSKESSEKTCFRCNKDFLKLEQEEEFICSDPECGLYLLPNNVKNLEMGETFVNTYTYKRISGEKYDEFYQKAQEKGCQKIYNCESCGFDVLIVEKNGGFGGSNFFVDNTFICSNRECGMLSTLYDSS